MLPVAERFLVINTIYLVFSLVACVTLRDHRRRWTARELGAVMRSPATPGISILVPAFNEAANVAESVRSLLFLAAVVYGAMISIASVILQEVSFRRYPRLRDLLVLACCGVIENLGCRQLATWWRVRGVFRFLRGRQDWGAITRKGFEKAS
jgi:hypothetical protein